MRDKILTLRQATVPAIRWNSPKWIEIPFRKKLTEDWSEGMLAIIRCRIFCHPVCNPKTRLRYTEI